MKANIEEDWLRRDRKVGFWFCKKHTGLAVRAGVKKNAGVNVKTFYHQAGGKRIKLGTWPEMSLATARDIVGGEIELSEHTIGTALERWQTVSRARNRSETTIANQMRLMRKWVGDDFDLKLDNITKRWLTALQDRITSPHSAKEVIKILRREHRLHTDSGKDPFKDLEEIYTPITGTRRQFPHEHPHEYWAVITRAESLNVRLAYLWLVTMGLRRNEILAARWEHLRGDEIFVYNAKASAKGGSKAFWRPLPAQVLERMPERISDSPWIFPSGKKHMKSPEKTSGLMPTEPTPDDEKMNKTLVPAGMHQVRHWWRVQAEEVAPFKTVQTLMNHSEVRSVTDVYGSGMITNDAKREASQLIADRCWDMLQIQACHF